MRSEKTTRLLLKADALEANYIGVQIKNYPPERVIEIDGYTCLVEDKTDQEITTILLAKQTIYLKTIRNIIVFFFITWLLGSIIMCYYFFKFFL